MRLLTVLNAISATFPPSEVNFNSIRTLFDVEIHPRLALVFTLTKPKELFQLVTIGRGLLPGMQETRSSESVRQGTNCMFFLYYSFSRLIYNAIGSRSIPFNRIRVDVYTKLYRSIETRRKMSDYFFMLYETSFPQIHLVGMTPHAANTMSRPWGCFSCTLNGVFRMSADSFRFASDSQDYDCVRLINLELNSIKII